MKISVVIPAFNEEKLVGACVSSVHASFSALDEKPEYEVLVCDNASTDGTAQAAETAGARVVFEPLNQIAAARNTGAAAASGDWLLFIDADSLLSAATLRAALALMAAGTVAGGGAVMRFSPAPPWWGELLVAAWNAVSRLLTLAPGAFFFCRADAFREAGGFDRRLYAGEELAMSRTLKRWGRSRGLGFAIITTSAHVCSSRKFFVYSFRELTGFTARFLAHPFKSVRSPEKLEVFYNARRLTRPK